MLQNKDDLLLLMEYVHTFFRLQEKQVIDKEFITPEDIHKYQKQHHLQHPPEFLAHMITQKNSTSASEYKDIKITGFSDINYLNTLYRLGVEIKFVLEDTNNENGMSFHGVYDLTKRIAELSRLEGYISRTDIRQYVDVFFQNLDTSLKSVDKTPAQWFSEVFWSKEMHLRKEYAEQNGVTFSRNCAQKDIQKIWNDICNPEESLQSYARNAVMQYLLTQVQPVETTSAIPKYIANDVVKQVNSIQDAITSMLHPIKKQK